MPPPAGRTQALANITATSSGVELGHGEPSGLVYLAEDGSASPANEFNLVAPDKLGA